MTEPNPETETDLLWAAVAGLRLDVERLTGRLERIAEAAVREPEEPDRDAEAVAEAWRKKRQEEIDRLLKEREALGKGEALDPEDEAALDREWMNR